MGSILLIETATTVCSVALSIDGVVAEALETDEPNAHSAKLTVLIEKLLHHHGLAPADLSAVAVSKGPGSYTGLRIGVSVAKGICYALDVPLIAVNTLASMASGMVQQKRVLKEDTLFCPMIDARRMEVYTAVFSGELDEIWETGAHIVTPSTFSLLLESHRMVFFGSGAAKCRSVINHPNAFVDEHFRPSATHMNTLAGDKFRLQEFEDTAYFEPYYLKDFIAGTPRVKGLFS